MGDGGLLVAPSSGVLSLSTPVRCGVMALSTSAGRAEEREVTVVRGEEERDGEVVAVLLLGAAGGFGVRLEFGQ
ncbi:hypothetical protein BU52_05135 [Streptomyces toyocaensis]|uniref:Uncharacterized protein n=1 Tax=Streptomyces toyocaensis TaxID=55952 RepID=A0A081XXY8_STRTO|nr:hypothetical protein BU52_05135 [Streptomyces toyocaensis]